MANGNPCYFITAPSEEGGGTLLAPPSVVTVGPQGEETLVPIPRDTGGKKLAFTVVDGVLSWQPFGRWEPVMYEGELVIYNGDCVLYLVED